VTPIRLISMSAGALIACSVTVLPALAQSKREMDAAVREYLLRNAKRGEIELIIKDYLAKNPEQVQQIVKDYLLKNPDLVQEVLTEYLKRRVPAAAAQRPAAAPDKSAAVKENAPALFSSAHQVTLGNPKGDVTLVEFFDYNCGFCKRALADKLDLMKSDPNLRIVLKEYPILGAGSVEAAQVAVAARMQDPGGEKYLAFHEKLLHAPQADKARALAVAGEVGLDVAQIERDFDSGEVQQTLEESRTLAAALSINGTPSYVVGDAVVVGAVGAAALKARIAQARQAKPN
jgi:protein-disulfide isomerase